MRISVVLQSGCVEIRSVGFDEKSAAVRTVQTTKGWHEIGTCTAAAATKIKVSATAKRLENGRKYGAGVSSSPFAHRHGAYNRVP